MLIHCNFPSNVHLFSTPRFVEGGLSVGKYGNFNLATHVQDDSQYVKKNRALLRQKYTLPGEPKWLEQVHSNICLNDESKGSLGDARVSQQLKTVCAVLTADCLPIFACNIAGTQVGVAHVGWRGLVAGVIENFVQSFQGAPLKIYFGAAISQTAFEVGEEVYRMFVAKNLKLTTAFLPVKGKYQLDIYIAARLVLQDLGIEDMQGGGECSFSQAKKYFSYRRDGICSGRMAHLIWMD
jgi:YfiH family protein